MANTTAQPNTGGYRSVTRSRRPRAGSNSFGDFLAVMVGHLVAENAFLANVAMFKTGDKMLGFLLARKS